MRLSMFYVALALLGLVLLGTGARLFKAFRPGLDPGPLNLPVRVFGALLLLVALGATSVIMVPANEVGIVRKVYGTRNLPEGRLIATAGETGYQAEIIAPGTFRISP